MKNPSPTVVFGLLVAIICAYAALAIAGGPKISAPGGVTTATAPLVVTGADMSCTSASSTSGGCLTTGTQTIAGQKSFNDQMTLLPSTDGGSGGTRVLLAADPINTAVSATTLRTETLDTRLVIGESTAATTPGNSFYEVLLYAPSGFRLPNQRVTANNFSCTAASGSNCYAATTNGARVDYGAGASDYASSDGTTVTFASAVATQDLSLVTGVVTTPNAAGSAAATAVAGTIGTAGAGSGVTAGGAGGAVTWTASAGGAGGTSGAGGVGGATSLICGAGGAAGTTTGAAGIGGAVVLTAGAGGAAIASGGASAAGGAITLTTGAGGAAATPAGGSIASAGGVLTLQCGNGGAGAGTLGAGAASELQIFGGTGGVGGTTGAAGDGSAVTVTTGTGGAAGTTTGAAGLGGTLRLLGGAGGAATASGGASATGGEVIMTAGRGGAAATPAGGAGGTGGPLTVRAGQGGAAAAPQAAGAGGVLALYSGGVGTAGAGTILGGAVILDTGTSQTNAENVLPTITIGTTNAGAVTVGRSGQTTNLAGGTIQLGGVLTFSRTAPTVTGFCTSPSVSANNGTAAFTITIGTSCAGVSTGTITLPAATTGWVCTCHDVTTPASFIIGLTGGATTTCTVTNYSRTTGLAADFTASDVLRCTAVAY